MDTIEGNVKLKSDITIEELDIVKKYFSNLKSPIGFRFCDVLEESRGRERGLILKLSYPRYYYGNNACLVTSKSKCLKVQEHFVNSIQEDTFLKEMVLGIKLTRVDIPFTYYMEEGLDFNSYSNIYRIFALVYNKKKNTRAKGFIDLEDYTVETVIYSDNGKSDKSSNNRLMIYNQYQNLKVKLGEEDFENTLKEYPDLISRMRLEVSKRIRRKEFLLDEFKNFDILSEYFQSYKKYILDNVLNRKAIEQLYDEAAEGIAEILAEERDSNGFNYEAFILRNSEGIYDYEIVKRAVRKKILNTKTRESAITKIRKILKKYEKREKIIVLNTYSIIFDMGSYIESLEIDD